MTTNDDKCMVQLALIKKKNPAEKGVRKKLIHSPFAQRETVERYLIMLLLKLLLKYGMVQ